MYDACALSVPNLDNVMFTTVLRPGIMIVQLNRQQSHDQFIANGL